MWFTNPLLSQPDIAQLEGVEVLKLTNGALHLFAASILILSRLHSQLILNARFALCLVTPIFSLQFISRETALNSEERGFLGSPS